MKTILLSLALFLCTFPLAPQTLKKQTADIVVNDSYSKASKLDSILKSYSPEILPGTSLAVYTKSEGWWASAAGYADIKNKIPMDTNHVQYLQSISKMFIAVEILKLKERGKINLEAAITDYLPPKFSKYFTGANVISVRMLLNHTSGIPEYNENPDFLSEVLQNPLNHFSTEDCLKAIEGRALLSPPGKKYRYTNTNYLLLALIGDELTGNHAKAIREDIFKPLGMKHSYYGKGYDYLRKVNLPRSYWDVFNYELPVDVTGFQQMTVVCSKGDDGIVATPTDAVKFLKGLFEGRLLKPESLKEMMSFVKDDNGRDRYGMGMLKFNIDGNIAYGHGGGGIGAGCGLIYIPNRELFAFFSTNIGVFADGKLPAKAAEMKDAIEKVLIQ